MRKIGINISDDSIFGVENFFNCISNIGFDSVFTMGNDEKFISYISGKCNEKGLIFESIHAPFNNINALWDKDSGKDVLATLKRSVSLAETYGVKIVVTHLSSGENCPTVTDAGLFYFDELAQFAAKKNIIIAVENQRKLGNISVILEKYSKDSNIQFCWDVGHEKCFAHGREYMPLFGNRCVTTHIHDNNMRYNCDEHLIPFDGQIDFRRTAELLNQFNYNGTLMLEIHLPESNSDIYSTYTTEQFVQKAYAAINRLRIISEY